ncbi:sugar diacid utilization regulator [Arthrobacter woluwensis]|uniref:PucR family transcriptional regulator n=1 Tax=Arthrobacter woluwensis TaxID=156980 RepID=UPI00277EA6F6|nr:helix-turn-helix domain-containing protein [Arthrobacter woluwensis]MDQ0710311.1 sugar diacid utilization regulator [Arthrobacter woluwensis]
MQQPDVEQLVEQLAARLGRGLSLEDLDGLLVAYSSNQEQADRVRVNFLLTKRVPPDVSAWQLSHGISAAVRPVVVPANEELGMLGRVCVPLLVRGFRVGYLWVQQSSGESSAAPILGQLAEVRHEIELLATLLLESNTAESEQRKRREVEFLSACSGERGAIAAVGNWAEVHGKGPWQLITVLDAGARHEPEDPLAASLTHRSAALQSTVGVQEALFSAGRPSHSVMLFRASQGRAVHAQVLVHYQLELAKRSGQGRPRIVIGLSEPFAEIRKLPDAYGESRTAALAGVVEPSLGELVDCRDTGIYQFFATAAQGPMDWGGASTLNFAALEAGDKNQELRPVLEMIYDTGGTVQDVADELHLHRSTVYNRLAKVRQIIGADPLKGSVRLELHAALKAARWHGRPRI